MNLINRNGRLGIDKWEIDGLIAAKNFIGLNRSPRAEKVIVSLTSYKPRINDVKYTIYSLLNQTFPPDNLILWLDEDSFPQREKNLPRDLLKLRSFGLTIDWCENLRSYKKLIPALEKYPDNIIVTADDDIFYHPDWLKILYDEHTQYPDCVVAHRCHRVRLDAQERLLSYNSWHHAVIPITPPHGDTATSSRAQAASFTQRNFFTSGAGALFKKKILHSDVLRRDIFTELAPNADDIWFWAMAVLNGTKIRIPAAAQSKLIYIDLDIQDSGETLWSTNQTQNDVQLRKVIERYPALLDKLIREAVDSKPYLTVIAPVKNPANLLMCVDNIFRQKFPDCELIVINLGARINLPPLPINFRVINYPGGSLTDALNLGLRKATGDYILFKGENAILPNDALDVAAQIAYAAKADVVHFAGHVRIVDNGGRLVPDDAPELYRDRPIYLDAVAQLRAVLWLQNKLSKRLDTKIFRRDFLTDNKLTFGGDMTEFMFHALTRAEKYLLVPQVFGLFKE